MILLFISSVALLVKVIARISDNDLKVGEKRKCRYRSIRVWVFPDPAEAEMTWM
jgi:hypothetical protein